METIKDILADLKRTSDPVAVLRNWIVAEGGVWSDPERLPGIVEIQLAGLVGIGPSVAAAADDWIVQAKAWAERSRMRSG